MSGVRRNIGQWRWDCRVVLWRCWLTFGFIIYLNYQSYIFFLDLLLRCQSTEDSTVCVGDVVGGRLWELFFGLLLEDGLCCERLVRKFELLAHLMSGLEVNLRLFVLLSILLIFIVEIENTYYFCWIFVVEATVLVSSMFVVVRFALSADLIAELFWGEEFALKESAAWRVIGNLEDIPGWW